MKSLSAGSAVRNVGILPAAITGVLMSTGVTLAQNTAAPAAAPAAQPATQATPHDDPNEIICRAGEPTLGSRFAGPRICHTRREWDQLQRDSQDALVHQQMNRAANGGH